MKTRLLPLLGALALPLTSAFATVVIVDQQNTLNGTAVSGNIVGTGVGQSFTPALTAIDAIDLTLATSFTTSSVTLRLDLFSGGGYGGTLLGSTQPMTLGGGLSFSTIHFIFPSLITLVPQNIYTFRVTLVSTAGSGGYTVTSSVSNPYSGGSEFGTNGTANTGNDLVFTEGQSIPEPSTALLGLSGSASMVLLFRRRSNRKRRG